MSDHLIWTNEARTILITQWPNQSAGGENLYVATRPEPDAVWGPPVECEPDKHSRREVRTDRTDGEELVTLTIEIPSHAKQFIERIAKHSELEAGEAAETLLIMGVRSYLRRQQIARIFDVPSIAIVADLLEIDRDKE